MPRRTNEFQKLVYLVKEHVAAGATVTESKLLPDRYTGKDREVDICIEAVIAGHRIIVAIECTGQTTPADVSWIDEMMGKHDCLPTNQLVLASKSGFTREAVAKAQIHGIELISIDKMDADEAKRLFGGASSIWLKLFNMNATKVVMHVGASADHDLDAENVAVAPDTTIYDAQGREVGIARTLVESLVRSDQAVELLGKHGDESHKFFVIVVKPLRDKDGNILFLQKLEPLLLRPIEWVRITGTCNFNVSEFKLRHGRLKDVSLAWGTGSFRGRKSLFVASAEGAAGKITITGHPNQ
jgi:hypothetical protein